MYQIHVTYPSGIKGIVCREVDNPDDLEVFTDNESRSSYKGGDVYVYATAEYYSLEEAQGVAADIRQSFDDETEVEVVEVEK